MSNELERYHDLIVGARIARMHSQHPAVCSAIGSKRLARKLLKEAATIRKARKELLP